MNIVAQNNIQKARNWLTQDVFPLWFDKGFDPATGCFFEAFSGAGEPLKLLDRRAMVQARQIYAVTEAVRLELFSREQAAPMIKKNTQLLITRYLLPSGGYAHSVNSELLVSNSDTDLYTQAFVLFGFAKAYELLKDEQLIEEAQKLLNYLIKNRCTGSGGFTEIKNGKTLYQSNPHMHLFEAALAWVEVSQEDCFKKLADDLAELCTSKFIHSETHFLAEHYDQPWQPQLIGGNFIFEPGHHHEWSWLLQQYQRLTGTVTLQQSESLFKSAEQYGLSENKKFVVDEVLSNGKIYKKSARFWPQTERIKAATQLKQAQAADQAFDTLFLYFEGVKRGLWQDTLQENGQFVVQPSKASSLYHIMNALSEYILKRPHLSN